MAGVDLSAFGKPPEKKEKPDLSHFGDALPAGTPTLSPHKRSLAERYDDNYDAGRRGSLSGAAADVLATNVVGSMPGEGNAHVERNRARNKDEADSYQLRSETDPWYEAPGNVVDKAAAGLATLGGIVAGTMTSPEAMIAPGRSPLGRIGYAAGVNAAIDPPIQGLQNLSGSREGYDPLQTVGAAATGMVIQGGFEGAGKLAAPAIRSLRTRLTPVEGNPTAAAQPNPTTAPGAPVAPSRPASVDDVWSGLVKQESGNRQFDKDGKLITSSAGAGGVAQLMPATAREVAKKLGDPSLADLAFQPTEAGRAANERLGRAYYQEMLDRYGGDHELAAAAYNAGPGRVDRALRKHGRANVLAHLPQETQHYVKVVVGNRLPGAGAPARGPGGELEGVGSRAEPEPSLPTGAKEPSFVAPEPEPLTPNAPKDIFDNDNPIPTTPTKAPEPARDTSADPLTDRALDHIRTGKPVKEDRGPSLVQWVQKQGAKDEGGELSAIGLDRWHIGKPFSRKVIREDGWSLDDLAVAAQERGYLPERFGDGDNRATPQQLLDAMREELSGRPSFARDDLDGAALKQRVDDLDEILNVIGIDPKTKSNAEITEAISSYWSTPDRAVALPDRLGLGPSRAAPERLGARDLGDLGSLSGDRLQSTRGGLAHQRMPEQNASGQAPVKNVRDMMHDLTVSLDLTARRGRLRGRKSLGEYDTKSGVIRSKHANDIDVLVHEAGHKLEFTDKMPALEAAMTKHAKTLEPLDYDKMQNRRHEGFAEWFRLYVTNPDVAERLAPDFKRDFEAAMAVENPKALAAIQGIQRDYDGYLKADSLERGVANLAMNADKGLLAKLEQEIKDKGTAKVMSNVMDRAYTWFIDDLAPIQFAEKELAKVYAHNKGAAPEIKSAESPYVHARLSRDAYSAGRVDALHGVVPYRGIDPEGPSLSDGIAKVFGDKWTDKQLDEFDVYLASRRLVREWDRFNKGELRKQPDRYSKAEHLQRIENFEAKNPTAKDAATLVYEWMGNLWKKEYEAGFLTESQYLAGLKKMDYYVPVMRDMSDSRNASSGGKSGGDGKNAGGVKRFEGSRRDVVSPITSMMKRAYELNINIKRNDVIGTLDRLAQKAGPGAGSIVERLPEKEIEAYNTDALAALEKAMKENDWIDEMDATTIMEAASLALEGNGKVQMFRRRNTEARPDELVVWHWEKGRKIPLLLADGAFGRELYTSIAGMDRHISNVFVDIAAAITNSLRMGITLTPEFVAANIVRDQQTVWVNTDVGFKPGISYAMGAKEQLADGVVAKRYQAVGGIKGGLNTSALTKANPSTDGLARRQRQDLNKANYRARTFRLNQNPLHLAAALTDISEAGSRLSVFKLAFDKAKKNGLTDYEAAVEAGITGRDYLDYGRRGSKMLTAVRLVTFLNSSLQSIDKSLRIASGSDQGRPTMAGLKKVLAPIGKGAPVTKAQKAALALAYKAAIRVSMLTAFGAGLAAIYVDDPEYQELTSYERSTAWWFRVNGTWWRIPKPFELAVPSNIAERLIEGRMTDDPTIGMSILADLYHTVFPPHSAPAISVPLEIMRNRDSFGRPIVPDHKRKSLDPELQYNAYTSKLSKMMGRVLGVAPAVLDHIVTGTLGSAGRYALQLSDLATEAATGKPRMGAAPEDFFMTRRFSGDPMRGSKSQARFWDLMSPDGGKFTRAEGTFRAYMAEGTAEGDAKAIAHINSLKPEERAFVLAKAFSEDGSSGAHPMVRAQKSVSVLSDIRHELREGTFTEIDGRPIRLTPDQLRRADQALTAMSTAELRNALVAIGEKGWAQKDMLSRGDPKKVLAELGLLGVVETRQQLAKVPPAGAVLRLWGKQRAAFEAEVDPEVLGQLMTRKRLKSSDTETKRREIIRQRGPQ